MRFGKLVVIRRTEERLGKIKLVLCQCDCGKQCKTRAAMLYTGAKKSCGCIYRTRSIRSSQVLREDQKLRRIWYGMVRRCSSDGSAPWMQDKYYARGIRVCDRWIGQHGFDNFLIDMGPRPSPRHSIDRINTLLGYSPENCRWATLSEQARNRKNTTALTLGRETMCRTDWANRYGMSDGILCRRLERGMDLQEALNKPVVKKKRLADGRLPSNICKAAGLSRRTVYARLRRGMTMDEALSTPLAHPGWHRKTLG